MPAGWLSAGILSWIRAGNACRLPASMPGNCWNDACDACRHIMALCHGITHIIPAIPGFDARRLPNCRHIMALCHGIACIIPGCNLRAHHGPLPRHHLHHCSKSEALTPAGCQPAGISWPFATASPASLQQFPGIDARSAGCQPARTSWPFATASPASLQQVRGFDACRLPACRHIMALCHGITRIIPASPRL